MTPGPTLYQAKPWFQAALRPLVRSAAGLGVQPNHLTVSAVGVSVAAGAVVVLGGSTPALLWIVPALYLVRMALNAMDGLLAREHGMTSPAGAVLNEVGDVLSDAVAYLPFALVFPDHATAVVLVVALGMITEVAALAAAPPTGGRRNDGPLGKSDRALAFGLLAVMGAVGLTGVAVLLWPLAGLAALTVVNRSRGVTA